jgi:hypothetical protein
MAVHALLTMLLFGAYVLVLWLLSRSGPNRGGRISH